MGTLGDSVKSTSREVDIIKQDIAIFKNLIKERKQPLDLVRELVSNAGAREVGASVIEISYTKDKEGHIFEVSDDGCGMNFTGRQDLPGRLDRFLGLGLSGIVGQHADEFSWKGLGSKLAYQSKRVEVSSRHGDDSLYEVRINEPWQSLERNLLPKPRVTEHSAPDEPPGTKIKVFGHPPHRQEDPFSFEEIRAFLLHRTFVGFTRPRENHPRVSLSVLGHTEEVPFGFPEFSGLAWQSGFILDEEGRTLFVNIVDDAHQIGLVCLKGFLTWDAERFDLGKGNLNTGLILSSRGIPYFGLNMDDYGAPGISHANPGEGKSCLVVEADGIYSEMNISRSDLVDSQETLEFRRCVGNLFERLETSAEYLRFRQIPKMRKTERSAQSLDHAKAALEADDQPWVVCQREGHAPIVLGREPSNETEVLAVLWKLEALSALPFERFRTLAYPGAKAGPDLIVNFQEEKSTDPIRLATFEVENNFYSYKSHGHYPGQYPKVICWDVPSSGRKVRLTRSQKKKYKYTINLEDYQVHVFALRQMDCVSVLTRRELKGLGSDI